jgi:hypothetical protein
MNCVPVELRRQSFQAAVDEQLSKGATGSLFGYSVATQQSASQAAQVGVPAEWPAGAEPGEHNNGHEPALNL